MAERRLFTKKITESDAFLDMPLSSQCLYFHLNMNADDDGFVDKPRTIMRMIGAKDDDIRLLIQKNFIITFESGVVVIKHWLLHNIIRKDRYKETEYKEEKSKLFIKENDVYTTDKNQGKPLLATIGKPSDNQMDAQDKLSKDKLSKDNINTACACVCEDFLSNIPTLQEIEEWIILKGFHFKAKEFFDFYDAVGWKQGNTPITNWKAKCGSWEERAMKEQCFSKQDPNKYIVQEGDPVPKECVDLNGNLDDLF